MSKLEKLREYMAAEGIDGMLVSNPENVRWISGYSGDSAQLLITHKQQYLITDSRYIEHAEKELGDGYLYIKAAHAEALWRIDKLLDKHGAKCLGIEKRHVTIEMMQRYQESWFVNYAYIDDMLASLRAIKDEAELSIMREGAALTERVFEHLLGYIKEDVSEYDLLAEMQYFMNKNGVSPSFTPIIASGENGSMPHAAVSGRKLAKGDFVTFDFGCYYRGYCTDMTRTIALFGVDKEKEIIYNTVMSANLAGIEAVKAGAPANEIDAAARDIIAAAGFGDFFEHGTGHGVGAEIHEKPVLSAYSTDVLESGMIVTVEPGIYIPGKYGVRIEDMLLVTADGSENFYSLSKELVII